jgi:hypothetical protein
MTVTSSQAFAVAMEHKDQGVEAFFKKLLLEHYKQTFYCNLAYGIFWF